MNKGDIIRLMQEVDPEMIINLQDHGGNMEDFTGEDPKLLQFWPFKNYVKFAALVAAAEREACVELCLEHSKLNVDNENVEFSHLASYEFGKQVGAATCATAIRARGEA